MFSQGSSNIFKPKIIIKPSGSKVIVLAPHPDDEVLGCGGVIRKHVESGDFVTILFLTDGRWGKKPNEEPHHVAELRQREAISASRILGTAETVFLGREDGCLTADKETIDEVQKIIISRQPNIVYAPHPFEPHRDHQATYEIAETVLRGINFKGSLMLYEVWKPIEHNVIVNITDVMVYKLMALRCYSSQLALHDYVDMIKSLNRYRMLQVVNRKYLLPFMKRERLEREKRGYSSHWPWRYAEVFFEVEFSV